MAKKKNIVKKVEKAKQEIQDTVVFMTAYDIHGFKQHLPRFWQRSKAKELLKQYHISGISYKSMYVSPDAKCNYSVEYDSLKQVSAFHFEENIVETNKKYPQFLEDTLLMRH